MVKHTQTIRRQITDFVELALKGLTVCYIIYPEPYLENKGNHQT